jgi:hypothetical protein
MKLAVDTAGVKGPPRSPGEYKTLARSQQVPSLLTPMPGEGGHGAGCQVDSPPTSVCFWLDEHHSTKPFGQPLERTSHRESATLEVDVRPDQSEGLSEPQTRCGKKDP